ncbi:MAG: polysaccharide deacetylase family protein, partial [Methylocystis sp.]|nr:polysaccharide deacetylase family protein [Methylocystis sp.]
MAAISLKPALLLLTASFLAASSAHGKECGPDALGVARVIEINRHKGATVGLQTYPRTLALKDHEVILTFDDGPAGPTPRVLDALACAGVKATFFLIGRNAEAWPAMVRRIASDGHTVACHLSLI